MPVLCIITGISHFFTMTTVVSRESWLGHLIYPRDCQLSDDQIALMPGSGWSRHGGKKISTRLLTSDYSGEG